MAEERGDCNREMTVFWERILRAAKFAAKASKRRESGPIANPQAKLPPALPGIAPAALPRRHRWP